MVSSAGNRKKVALPHTDSTNLTKTPSKNVLNQVEKPVVAMESPEETLIRQQEAVEYGSLDINKTLLDTLLHHINQHEINQACWILRDYLQLSPPPSTMSVLLAPFDSLHKPPPPHFPTQDIQSRDHITVYYYIQAIKFGHEIGLSVWSNAVWFTIFKQTHQSYCEHVQTTLQPNVKECSRLFKKIFTNVTHSQPRLAFTSTDIQQLVTFFTSSYIQHIKLITRTFTHMQTRIQHSKRSVLEPISLVTPLAMGVQEEKWDDFVKQEQVAAEKARMELIEMALQREKEQLEASIETNAQLELEQVKDYLHQPIQPFAPPLLPSTDPIYTCVDQVVQDQTVTPQQLSHMLGLDAILSQFSVLTQSVEQHLTYQLQEMEDRVDRLRQVLEKHNKPLEEEDKGDTAVQASTMKLNEAGDKSSSSKQGKESIVKTNAKPIKKKV